MLMRSIMKNKVNNNYRRYHDGWRKYYPCLYIVLIHATCAVCKEVIYNVNFLLVQRERERGRERERERER